MLSCTTKFPRLNRLQRAHYSLLQAEFPGHVPVLLQHVINILQPKADDRVVDCTAGLGGHASAIAQRLGPSGTITLLDADASNLQVAVDRVRSSVGKAVPSVSAHHMNFRHMSSVVPAGCADIIIADLGVCSSQIDSLCRGFSFRTHGKGATAHPLTDVEAPLDMRFDQSPTSSCVSVSDWLRRSKPFDVAHALMKFGEVKPSAARRIAAAIEAKSPVTTTKQLRDIVVSQTGEVHPPLAQVCRLSRPLCTCPRTCRPTDSHTTQVFQALRMVVNDELSALGDLMRDGITALAPGGRLAVISFHSLEDRLVKNHFRLCSTDTYHPVTGHITRTAPFTLLTKRAVQASQDEVACNTRARSARLRVLMKNV